MKKIIIIILFSFSFIQAGHKISDFKLKDINNRLTSFSKVQGEKLTIIDFWATWCKPCIQAIPKLNKIYATYKDQGIEIIGINVDSPRNAAKVKPFAKTYKIDYKILRDPNSEIATDLNVVVFPTLYIINAENEIVYSHQGFRPGDEKLIISELERLLKKDEKN